MGNLGGINKNNEFVLFLLRWFVCLLECFLLLLVSLNLSLLSLLKLMLVAIVGALVGQQLLIVDLQNIRANIVKEVLIV